MFLIFYNNSNTSRFIRSQYLLTVEECLNAIFKAKWYRFFDLTDFNIQEYDTYGVSYDYNFFIDPMTSFFSCIIFTGC